MTRNDTEQLIQKYLNCETTAEEERLLALEVSREDAPEDWKIIAEMLGELTVDEALFDQEMAERRPKPRIMKLWPWVAAACVAALLIVVLAPPKEDFVAQTPVAKVEVKPQTKVAEAEATETMEKEPILAAPESQQISKAKRQVHASKRIKKEKQEALIAQEAEPKSKTDGLVAVEKEDIIPFDDPHMQFAEQARALRERGNRVIQRVSMNLITPDNHQLYEL